jgi:hypothetical protein
LKEANGLIHDLIANEAEKINNVDRMKLKKDSIPELLQKCEKDNKQKTDEFW